VLEGLPRPGDVLELRLDGVDARASGHRDGLAVACPRGEIAADRGEAVAHGAAVHADAQALDLLPRRAGLLARLHPGLPLAPHHHLVFQLPLEVAHLEAVDREVAAGPPRQRRVVALAALREAAAHGPGAHAQ